MLLVKLESFMLCGDLDASTKLVKLFKSFPSFFATTYYRKILRSDKDASQLQTKSEAPTLIWYQHQGLIGKIQIIFYIRYLKNTCIQLPKYSKYKQMIFHKNFKIVETRKRLYW